MIQLVVVVATRQTPLTRVFAKRPLSKRTRLSRAHLSDARLLQVVREALLADRQLLAKELSTPHMTRTSKAPTLIMQLSTAVRTDRIVDKVVGPVTVPDNYVLVTITVEVVQEKITGV